ncbi:complex I assembly factor ACAD9, mitochondrial-like [Musca vetustissima]|uniref:complex I assembly factor ACAD9, mitochondrial-like n=1 Tax=Musca vetustissima TaxID=27455 RepID=UPI002AB7573B|nr:complex I assembly factor ACAD9, mitochondrial-like [Musca vetustissima]
MLRTTQVLALINKTTRRLAISSSNRFASSSSVTDAPEPEEQVAGATTKKLPPRLPLVKNFFVGLVDNELLAFPEVINREDMSKLQNELLPLKNFFNEDLTQEMLLSEKTLPKELPDNLKSLGLYGLNVSKDFDGKGWGYSESLMASEPESAATDVALSLLGHRAIVDVIQELGSDEQKNQLLTKLGNGSLVASEAIFEFDGAEDDFFNTKAHHELDTHTWILNGGKAFVICPPKSSDAAQLFLVVAQTSKSNVQTEAARSTTIFLVDSTMPGVKIGDRHATIGCGTTAIHHVQFENVRVPQSCILGHAHEGNVVADALLKSSRLRNSMVGLGLAKSILNEISQECIDRKLCGVVMKDLESVQTHLAKSYLSVYSMESMIYMTAGLLDEFNYPDVAVESAVTKYFTLKELLNISIRALDLIGPKSLIAGQTTEQFFRNASHLYTQGESVDNLSIFIALAGLQHAGTLMGDNIRKQRNPLYNPGHIFSKFMDRSTIDNPVTKMDCKEHLHPTLEPAALCLEHSVARLQMCVDLLFTRYGSGIVERHNESRRVADMATTIYAMFSSLARASRSYCIGLQHADHEMLTAMAICADGRDKVMTITKEIFNGSYVNNDNNLQRLSRQIVKSKGYFATHPLTYNF